MMNFRRLSVLLCFATIAACEKNAVQDITGTLPGARIRFHNFGVNAPGVNFYANDTKMSAISSATGVESITGVVYGGLASGGLYSGIAPGQYTLSGKIAAATDKDLAIAKATSAIVDGKFYSFYMSGLYDATAKTSDAFVVEDPLPATDFTGAHVRFVNAIFNANPMTLYARNTTTLEEVAIGGPVAYKSAGAFTKVPNGVYDVNARFAGSSTNTITLTNVSFSAGRVYTVSARGDITVVSTTLPNRPILANSANR